MEDETSIGFLSRVKWFFKFFFWSIGWTDAWIKSGKDLGIKEKEPKKIISCGKKDTN